MAGPLPGRCRSCPQAKWCLRVARRISRTSFSASTRTGGADDFWLIFTLLGVTMSQKSCDTQIANLLPWAMDGAGKKITITAVSIRFKSTDDGHSGSLNAFNSAAERFIEVQCRPTSPDPATPPIAAKYGRAFLQVSCAWGTAPALEVLPINPYQQASPARRARQQQ